MAGEHLNKQIKQIESGETNQDLNRFKTVTKLCRVRQFYYSSMIFKTFYEKKCSRCHQHGHPEQPMMVFPNSDDEM